VPRITIDGRTVEVEEGTSLLEAARRLGIEVPALCAHPGLEPSTSCLACVVRVNGEDRLRPSCATLAEEGMQVESECASVHEARRTALELLFSEHLGECRSPCQRICPLDVNVPLVMRQVQRGDMPRAIVELREALPLPWVLGHVCPAHCEQGCRRSGHDDGAAIRALERAVAEADRAEGSAYVPPCAKPSGRRVAVVGAGPCGLSAAYFLLRGGHAVTLFEAREKVGGTLREVGGALPATVLDAEVETLRAMGAELRLSTRVGEDVRFQDLLEGPDAVLVAAGSDAAEAEWASQATPQGLRADPKTHQTPRDGLFAAGDAVRPSRGPTHAMADGKRAAVAIGQYLAGEPVVGPRAELGCSFGRLRDGEVQQYLSLLSPSAREARTGPRPLALAREEAVKEAERCLRCDCAKVDTCALRLWGERYGVATSRHKTERKRFERRVDGRVVFEPGKCILCGICIQLAEQEREPLGLTFIGRGFDVQVGVPFDRSLDEALTRGAARCVEACPTGALSLRDGEDDGSD
jgi:ferredoxin